MTPENAEALDAARRLGEERGQEGARATGGQRQAPSRRSVDSASAPPRTSDRISASVGSETCPFSPAGKESGSTASSEVLGADSRGGSRRGRAPLRGLRSHRQAPRGRAVGVRRPEKGGHAAAGANHLQDVPCGCSLGADRGGSAGRGAGASACARLAREPLLPPRVGATHR